MFQQHQGESLYDAWNHFKELLRKVPHCGLDLWLQVQIFYDHVNYTTQMAIDDAAGGRLRILKPKEAWKTIKDLAQYEEEEWNEQIFSGKRQENKLEYEDEDEDEVKIKMMGTGMDKESLEHNLYEDNITLIICHKFSPTLNPPIKPKYSGNFRIKVIFDEKKLGSS
ncbi:hypothetical protein Tco_0286949 [Tanacetum coccineum]